MNTVNVFFERKLTCPVCDINFTSTAIRPSKIKRKKTHSDFYVDYEEFNPNYYLVFVCPKCGYAYLQSSQPLNLNQKNVIKERITVNWRPRDFGGKRDAATAIEAFKLALLCGQLTEERDNLMAGIAVHIAWIYREAQDEADEQRFMKLALTYYQRIFETATFEVDVARNLYMLGELSRRLGDLESAFNWFRKIIDDKRINDATIIRLAREQYAEAREEYKRLKNQNSGG
ncbi:MAG: DUF2225 domain-containing protein [Bacillota bacterium]|nr:DUF2225 domain-containing protein [Bacillota bacterium]